MSEITGRLLAELHPNGTVRLVFIAHTGDGNEVPMTAKSLDTAEIDFVNTCGLTPERAAALRAELHRNKFTSVATTIGTLQHRNNVSTWFRLSQGKILNC